MSYARTEKTIMCMIAEVREINIAKGWRPAAGGPGTNTFGDYIALLHSELSEALEAYRDHRLADATGGREEIWTHAAMCEAPIFQGYRDPKPAGVGSEFADVLIRLLDTCDVFGVKPFETDMQLADVSPVEGRHLQSFGDWTAWLHEQVARLGKTGFASLATDAAYLLRALVGTAEHFGIDLGTEYERKVTYNRTRPYQHGGRTLADA
jgi:NTP pyrophosphatase (non-canonical NTP hydrolase)